MISISQRWQVNQDDAPRLSGRLKDCHHRILSGLRTYERTERWTVCGRATRRVHEKPLGDSGFAL